MESIAATIRAERARRGWKQTELAEKANRSVRTIITAEQDGSRVRLETLLAIGRALGIPTSRLLEGHGEATGAASGSDGS